MYISFNVTLPNILFMKKKFHCFAFALVEPDFLFFQGESPERRVSISAAWLFFRINIYWRATVVMVGSGDGGFFLSNLPISSVYAYASCCRIIKPKQYQNILISRTFFEWNIDHKNEQSRKNRCGFCCCSFFFGHPSFSFLIANQSVFILYSLLYITIFQFTCWWQTRWIQCDMLRTKKKRITRQLVMNHI